MWPSSANAMGRLVLGFSKAGTFESEEIKVSISFSSLTHACSEQLQQKSIEIFKIYICFVVKVWKARQIRF